MNELRRAALYYVAGGLPVFPCVPGGKRPLTKHGLKDASTAERQVLEWWSRWRNANIGIPTGPASGWFVIDLDGEQGLASWAALEATHGVTATLEQMTGGGGVHLVFAYPPGVTLGNTTGKLGPGVDTRGTGGYVLVPPSVHPSGRRYAWHDDSRKPAPCPPWLVELLQPAAPSAMSTPAERTTVEGEPDRLLARFQGLLDFMAAAQKPAHGRPGNRNARLYWCACRLRELLDEGAPRGWEDILVRAAVDRGLAEQAARKTVKSGLGAARR